MLALAAIGCNQEGNSGPSQVAGSGINEGPKLKTLDQLLVMLDSAKNLEYRMQLEEAEVMKERMIWQIGADGARPEKYDLFKSNIDKLDQRLLVTSPLLKSAAENIAKAEALTKEAKPNLNEAESAITEAESALNQILEMKTSEQKAVDLRIKEELEKRR